MRGRDLLKLLLIHHRMNPNQLATALHGKVGQPQIHKFLKGDAKEPRRTTLAPIAAYFRAPLDAFYDESVAWDYALSQGLLPASSPLTDGKEAQPTTSGTTVNTPEIEAPPPTYLPAAARPPLRTALRVLREAIAPETPGVRRSVIAILGDLAERADDEAFGEQMIERVLGALGHTPGNAPLPESTSSVHLAKRAGR